MTAEQFFKAVSQWGKESGCLNATVPVPEKEIEEFQVAETSCNVVSVLYDAEKEISAVQI